MIAALGFLFGFAFVLVSVLAAAAWASDHHGEIPSTRHITYVWMVAFVILVGLAG